MEWRKSSRSGNAGNCVELRQDLSAVRDSKHPAAPLPLPRSAVQQLIARVSR
ncbi:DUF397 domain-containing protein [Actinokineospora sp. G85]|uniref:DUF397 domain-containing protein n=1 Tax=Actinokineospora sp. G85 TaxID=3406626 RepID=UPI003C716AEB